MRRRKPHAKRKRCQVPFWLIGPLIGRKICGSVLQQVTVSIQFEAIAKDREELNEWIRLGTIRFTMISGDTVDFTSRELVKVSTVAVVGLVRCEVSSPSLSSRHDVQGRAD